MPELRPVALPANQPRHFYRGGAGIGRFRGAPPPDEYRPEDWVGSATSRFGGDAGLTVLPDGRSLRTAIAEDPAGWLGPEHVRAWGESPALLVKLLDAGQRLPVHVHPTREFARDHLGSVFGKTEAWLVMDVPDGGEGRVHLGFREDVGDDRLREWIRTQNGAALLGAMNEVAVRPGDAVLIPAGLPHAIDAGVFLVEVQEPTDFSIVIEWEGFLPAGADADLRLGWDTAVRCVDGRGHGAEEVGRLVRRPSELPEARPGVRRVWPEGADPFFRAELVGAGAELDPSFAVLIVLHGSGELRGADGMVPLGAGRTVLVPYGAGPATVHGDVEVLRCLPPVADGSAP
ncbi:class I mannose-6-phosphate isomerase [Actinomadura nitritigenes]|uniref:Class I mannose-6-phosphate isomerase n=1 Tax=Actinomadura nitritigenes TaxID=134602 RepID=A0ABS3RCT4_9ACTN|nr:class I mannose-6-phosphate isomerase [Actinomadura nitritigenes]MBO2443394.1 class I mannose-6-phosphate isomerase [Actinomadura nitritigenes]